MAILANYNYEMLNGRCTENTKTKLLLLHGNLAFTTTQEIGILDNIGLRHRFYQ